ncbi:MAG: nucleotide exchange factor GrpE [Thermodesulfobacteriota bacterium]
MSEGKEKKKAKNKGKGKADLNLTNLLDEDEPEEVLEVEDTLEEDQNEKESEEGKEPPQIDLPASDEGFENKLETFDRVARLKIKRKPSKDEPSLKKGEPLELDDPKPTVLSADGVEQLESTPDSKAYSDEDKESFSAEGDAEVTTEISEDTDARSEDKEEVAEDDGLEELEEEDLESVDEIAEERGDEVLQLNEGDPETEGGAGSKFETPGIDEQSESVNGSCSEDETVQAPEQFAGKDDEDAGVLESTEITDEELEGDKGGYDELYERYLRIVADFENYKKRVIKEKADIMAYGNEELIKEFLTVVDNLERALQHSESPENPGSIVEGIKLVHRQFLVALEKFGVKPIEISPGEKFDPRIHQAIEHVESKDLSPGLVLSEILRGYMLKDKLIRPSLVAVSRAENPKETQGEEQELEESS